VADVGEQAVLRAVGLGDEVGGWAAGVSPTHGTRASLTTTFASHFSGSSRNRCLSLDRDHSTRNDARPSSDGQQKGDAGCVPFLLPLWIEVPIWNVKQILSRDIPASCFCC